MITAVKKIKANALNSRLFHQLCIENDEDFQCLLLQTEVRWLSKGNCLKRFYTLFNSFLDFFQESNPELYDKLKSSKTDIAYLTEMFSKFNLEAETLDAANSDKSEGRWHCRVLRSFSRTPQGYVSQIQRPIFSWNPWLADRSIYWTQYRGTNPSRRGICKFSKWRGSETKVQNLLPSLLDANSDSQALPNPVEWHQVVFHCFSDFLSGWEGIQRCDHAPHQTKKQTQNNRAWWTETAPDKPSSWYWQFDCNAPSPPISLRRVVVNDYSFSFTIYFMFSSRYLWLKNKC